MRTVTFTNKKNLFFRTLKSKVDDYFNSKNIDYSGSRKLLIKGIIQFSTAIMLYAAILIFNPPILLTIILSLLLGINVAVLGFNIMHEGAHNSFSKHRLINNISAYFLNGLGGNSYFWKVKHNINHHTFTNVEGLDADIDIRPFMRLHEGQKRYGIHRFQHIYFIVLYGISYIMWIFFQDFQKYFTGYIAEGHAKGLSLKEHIIFWTSKIAYSIVFIAVPILVLGLAKALIGYAVLAITCGIFLSVVFQLAHAVEATKFPMPNPETNKIEQEWAIHQVQTTANFATKNKTISWLLGGLNFQVEHHLFPRISHVHYPAINKMVVETCQEFNIQYQEYPSMFKAFRSHWNHIRCLGK
jgi:linoleoyl-CoA desaturase